MLNFWSLWSCGSICIRLVLAAVDRIENVLLLRYIKNYSTQNCIQDALNSRCLTYLLTPTILVGPWTPLQLCPIFSVLCFSVELYYEGFPSHDPATSSWACLYFSVPQVFPCIPFFTGFLSSIPSTFLTIVFCFS